MSKLQNGSHLHTNPSYDLTIHYLVFTQEMKTCAHKKPSTKIFIMASFILAPNLKQPKNPSSTGDWKNNKQWHIHKKELYPALR